MKLGIINNQYAAADFDRIKVKGLEFIEICCNHDPDCERFIAQTDALMDNIARTGLPVRSVGRWNSKPLAGGAISEDVRGLMYRFLDAAVKVGAKICVCGVNYDGSVSLYRNYTLAIKYLRDLYNRAHDCGITLAVCNCDWNNFIVTPKQWEVVLGEIDGLTIKYDPSHCYYRGGDYLAEMNGWLGRVSHFHIKGTLNVDGRRTDDPPAGMDAIRWPEVFALLYKHGYAGGLSIEPHSNTWRGELGEFGVDFTVKYVRQFLIE